MKRIRKVFLLLIITISVFLMFGCGKDKNQETHEKKPYTSLKVIAINDVHGTMEANDDTFAMPGLSWYVKEQEKDETQAVLVLSAGDMFQGTALSNYSYGRNMIEVMNDVGFDAMVLGNHEFDWDIETVLAYFDGNPANGEANFPLLSCNVMEKTTGELMAGLIPYQLYDYEQFQVGVIGYMGLGIESDIAASKVSAYEFVDPVPLIQKYAKELHQKGADFVIAMGHDAFDGTNNRIAALAGDEAVDYIINSHTHATYTRTLTNGNGEIIPVTQAGTACRYATTTHFTFNNSLNKSAEYDQMKNIDLGGLDIYEDETLKAKIAAMAKEIEPIMSEVLAVASRNVSRSSVAIWTADAILDAIPCDIAVINSGGIRNSAFPIRENSNVDVKKVYEIMPFDNLVKTATFTGAEIINILKISDAVYSSNIVQSGNSFAFSNGEAIDAEQTYVLACVDYLFDREAIIYDEGDNIEIVQCLVRDIMINALRELGKTGEKWLA